MTTAMQESGELILGLPMRDNDSGERTIRGYLIALLRQVWREQDGFSGKRPFGNSDWTSDLYLALVDGGIILATLHPDGDLDALTKEQVDFADQLIDAAICALGVA